MKLSIVATLYQSATYAAEFHSRSTDEAKKLAGDDYEIILVNDGSPDDSLAVAVELSETDPHLRVIDLSRNFGHHKAMMTGLQHATGDLIFLIDSDLEEEPEWLSAFHSQLQDEGCDVVFGVQKSRKGGWFERVSGSLFYTLFNLFTGFRFPRNAVTARLMTRRYVNALLLHQEREIAIGGLYYITGFQQSAHTIRKHSTSESTYTFAKKLSIFVNSISSFSSKPLVGIFFLGLIILIVSLAQSLYYVVGALFFADPPSGWTSLMVSVWLLGGTLISCVGIVGIYIAKIYEESKQRPFTIVRDVYEQGSPRDPAPLSVERGRR